jgi:hypothetical protein
MILVSMFEAHNLLLGLKSRTISQVEQLNPRLVLTSNVDYRRKFCLSKNQQVEIQAKWLSSVNVQFVEVPLVHTGKSLRRFFANWIFSIKVILYLVNQKVKNEHILISSIPPELVCLLSWLAIFNKIKITLDVRDIWDSNTGGKTTIVHRVMKYYVRVLYYLTHKPAIVSLIYVSEIMKSSVSGRILCKGLAKNNQKFVPLGFDGSRWDQTFRKNLTKNRSLPYDLLNFISIGYFNEQTDITTIRLILEMTDANIHFCGVDKIHLDEFLGTYPKSRVFAHGFVSEQRLSDIILENNINFGLLPLKSNALTPLPNKLFDYIGTGIPIVYSGPSELSSFIENEWFGSNISNFVQGPNRFRIPERDQIILMRSKYNRNRVYRVLNKD